MSSRTWAAYDRATGLFSSRHVLCDEHSIAANTPAGFAVIEGRYDHLAQRIDVTTGQVVDYVPPAPDADHEWNADAKRWQKRADVIAAENAEAQARREIAQLEASQLRPLRELALDPTNATARAKLAAIEAEIAERRGYLGSKFDVR